MKLLLPTISTQNSQSSYPHVVFACAWCPSATYTALKENEQYSHGMCERHKHQFISLIKTRIERMRLRKKEGTLLRLPIVSAM